MLLSKTEKAYLSGNHNFSKRQQRDIRYRLRKKLTILNQELLIEENSGGVAELRDAAERAIGGGGSNLVGRGIANHLKCNNERRRGEWDFRVAPFLLRQHFEPTRPFGHGISNPTPYQARRPPQLFGVPLEV